MVEPNESTPTARHELLAAARILAEEVEAWPAESLAVRVAERKVLEVALRAGREARAASVTPEGARP